MNSWFYFLLSDISTISKSSRNYGSIHYYIILFSVFTAFAILWLVMYLIDKNKKLEKTATKKQKVSLFVQLCRVHGLNSEQATLIKTMTDRAGLKPPEVIFVDPSLWSHCLEHCACDRATLVALMQKLFGTERAKRWIPEETNEICDPTAATPQTAESETDEPLKSVASQENGS